MSAPRTLEQFDTPGIARLLLRRGLPILVALIVLAFVALVAVSKVGDVSDRVRHVDAPLLIAAGVAYAGLQIALMEIWRHLLHRLHGSFGAEAEREAWQVSQLGKYVPTGAMLFVTRVLLAGRAGGSRPVAFTSTVYELFASFLAAVGVTAAAIGSMHALHDSAFRWAVYAAPLPLLVALHPRILIPLANKALARTGREPLPAGLSFGRVLAYVLVYVLTFLVAGLGILALTDAITHVPSSDVWLVVASFSVAYVASLLGFLLPAGIGVRESGMALALSAAMPLSVAIAVAVLSRLVQVCVELLLAGAAALVARQGRRADAHST